MSGRVDRDRLDPRTRRLLEAPIVPTLLRLGAPNVLIMLAQASVGLIETFSWVSSAPTPWQGWPRLA